MHHQNVKKIHAHFKERHYSSKQGKRYCFQLTRTVPGISACVSPGALTLIMQGA